MQYCLLDLIRLSVLMVLIWGSTNTFDPYCARISWTSSRHFTRVHCNYAGSTALSLPSFPRNRVPETLETWGLLVSSMRYSKSSKRLKLAPLLTYRNLLSCRVDTFSTLLCWHKKWFPPVLITVGMLSFSSWILPRLSMLLTRTFCWKSWGSEALVRGGVHGFATPSS